MQKFYFHSTPGQEVAEDDINLVSGNSALADDRIFAELFRPKAFDSLSMTDPTKFILPYSQGATIQPNGANGSVRVYPFRSYVCSNVDASTNSEENWQDHRSAIFLADPTGSYVVKNISANSSGDPRWDLLYARLDRDASDASVNRYVKTLTGETLTPLVVTLSTLVTVGIVTGTPGSPPALPTLPTDSGSTFYIPLCYVVVPDGFGATSIVLPNQIYEVFPTVSLSLTTGAATAKPANAMNEPGGAVITTAVTDSWGTTSTRPTVYMPPSMCGEEVVYIALDMQDANPSNWSQGTNTIVDDSRDWRYRLFHWTAQSESSLSVKFAWDPSASPGSCLPHVDSADVNSSTARMAFGMGRSFQADIAGNAVACYLNDTVLGGDMPVGEFIIISVNMSDGKLYVQTSAAPSIRAFIRLCSSAPYANK